LVALDQAQAFELGRHNGRVPMAAITLHAQVGAWQLAGNQGFELVGCHGLIREF
jgi:hypothetical protein